MKTITNNSESGLETNRKVIILLLMFFSENVPAYIVLTET